MPDNTTVEEEAPKTASETMSTNTAEDTDGTLVEAENARYAELNIGDEEFVIYDRENHQAWIQSTVAFGLEDLQ